MRKEDLTVTAMDNGYLIAVSGRANFDYAVPLRELAEKLVPGNWIQFDMEYCETMDSTFMGVLTMLAMKLRKSGSKVMIKMRSNPEAQFRRCKFPARLRS